MKKEFSYIVKPVNQDEYGVNYVVEYIDFPGITGGGDTQGEAVQIANEALEMYIETLELMEYAELEKEKENERNN